MRHIRTLTQALIGATILAGGLAALTPAARASTPVACSETALVAAVNHANSIGGDTLALASGCTYGMTSSHGGPADGPTPAGHHHPHRNDRPRDHHPHLGVLPYRRGQLHRCLTLTTGVALTNGSASVTAAAS